MADTLSTTSTLDNLLQVYLERRMIARLVPTERLYQFAEKRPLPANSGKQMVFNGWRNLAAASSTMTEGTSNSLVAMSARKVTATVVQYGRGVKISDLAAITTITDVVKDAVDILSTSAALTVDNACQLAIFKNALSQVGANAGVTSAILSVWMSSKASAFCANTSTTSFNASTTKQFGLPVVLGSTGTVLSGVSKTAPTASARASIYTVRKARNRLTRLNAIPMADGFFVGVAHPNFLDTLGRDATWQDWNKYAAAKTTMYKGERGQVEQVRFVGSTNIPRYAVTAHSVNLTPIFGQQCFAATELDGGIKMLVKNPGPSDTSNPFDLYSTVAYKVNIVAAVLNPSAGCVLLTSELL